MKNLNDFGFKDLYVKAPMTFTGADKMAKDEIIEEKKYPQYKGEGVAVWVNKDKNGKQYLSISVLNCIHVNAFKYEPKK